MTNFLLTVCRRAAGVAGGIGWWVAGVLLAGLLPTPALAQAPPWAAAVANSMSGINSVCGIAASAVDASGNVFVTGSFTGSVSFGATTLSSRGGADLFVAKYVPGTATWAWAQSGGGRDYDYGRGIAVRGSTVYVTGSATNDLRDFYGVRFGGTGSFFGSVQVLGATYNTSSDLVIAKYTDNGTSGSLNWTQVDGGTDGDGGNAIVVSGNSLYIAANITNNIANANGALFGSTATAPGTVPVSGASPNLSPDMLVAKYTDTGAAASLNWTQVGGGTGFDVAQAIAVQGTDVYVTGKLENNNANYADVLLGGTGTTPGTVALTGASSRYSSDVVVAKYTDNGATATLKWTQVGGGTDEDRGTGLAVGAGGVYVTGQFTNNTSNANQVLFGGSGTTPGTVPVNGASATSNTDLIVMKYTDNGTSARLAWTQVGGGTSGDYGTGIAISGRSIYVSGIISNSSTNTYGVLFGGNGTTPGNARVNGASASASADVVVAKYTDNGTQAALQWALTGGGVGYDASSGVIVHGNQVYVMGEITPPAAFPPFTIATPQGPYACLLGIVRDPLLSPTRAPAAPWLPLYPNPAHAMATLRLPPNAPRRPLTLTDAQGCAVRHYPAPAGPEATLDVRGLPAGVYVLRCGKLAQRLVVE